MKDNKNIMNINRFDIRYRCYGKSTYKTIVCINAAQQTIAAWRSFVSYFKKRNYRLVLFDLPGQGGSKILYGSSHVTLSEQCVVLKGLIDATCLNSHPHLFAASWGGAVAAQFASIYPQYVDKMILASFGLSANDTMKQTIMDAQQAIMNGKPEFVGEIIVSTFGKFLSPSMRNTILQQFEHLEDGQVNQFFDHISWSLKANLLKEICFKNICADTLLVNGEHDGIIDCHSLSQLDNIINSCKRVVVKEAGHFLHFERSDILPLYEDFYADALLPDIF